jgi:hypothetical protein
MIRQLLLLCLASSAFAQPSGVYCLFGIDENINDVNNAQAWNDSVVSGVAVRVQWSTLEPAQGTYSWAYLDNAVAKAQSTGKKVAISVLAGCFSPAWVYNLSHEFLTFTGTDAHDGKRMPAPWDPNYLSAWTTFISNLGARYGGLPAVAYFTVTGLGHGEECFLCANSKDAPQFNVQAWLSAAQQIVTAYDSASKGTPYLVVWGKPAPGQVKTQSGCMYQVYSVNNHVGFKADSLSSSFPSKTLLEGQLAVQLGQNNRPVVFQALRTSGSGSALASVVKNGETMRMESLECYRTDVDNPDCQAVLGDFNR